MNELERRVMHLIGENAASPDVFDADGIAEIRDALNDAIEEVCMLTGCIRRKWVVPLSAGSVFYMITSTRDRFLYPSNVALLPDNTQLLQVGLQELAVDDPKWMSHRGKPEKYALIGENKFAIFPASAGGGTLEVYGVAMPSRYSGDNDAVKLRDNWKWCVINRAVSEFWATRGDAQSAAMFFQKYANGIGIPGMWSEYASRRWKLWGGGDGGRHS